LTYGGIAFSAAYREHAPRIAEALAALGSTGYRNRTISAMTKRFNVAEHCGVPELHWALMLIGFAGLGFMAYRRAKKSVAV
jgi:hypothetical protein